jgi:hypothetical protein
MSKSEFIAVTEEDQQNATELLEGRLQALRERLQQLAPDGTNDRATVLLELARTLVDLERGAEGWAPAREAFDLYTAAGDWEQAAESCEALFRTETDQSLAALGQGVWISVTFPVHPNLTVAMLQHIIDETPDDSDGAAVAAATAHYIAELRTAEGSHERDSLMFFTQQMLGTVAKRHSQVEDQRDFNAWMLRLELDDPSKFLVRLRNVVDVLVQDDWWIDRAAIHASIPVN